MTPKGEAEGVVTFVVPMDQCHVTLNGVHRDAGHQGQARTLALTQERFWWLTLVENCKAMIRGCQHCRTFKGAIPKALLCLIRVYTPLELVHMDFTSIETDMELNKPWNEECSRYHRSFHVICHGIRNEGSNCQDSGQSAIRAVHHHIWSTSKAPQ